jgi:hypothetical protein
MRILGEDDLIECFGCRSDGVHDDRMPVTMGDHPPGGDRIENRAAIFIDKIGAVGPDDSFHRRFQRMLGKGMPDRG